MGYIKNKEAGESCQSCSFCKKENIITIVAVALFARKTDCWFIFRFGGGSRRAGAGVVADIFVKFPENKYA